MHIYTRLFSSNHLHTTLDSNAKALKFKRAVHWIFIPDLSLSTTAIQLATLPEYNKAQFRSTNKAHRAFLKSRKCWNPRLVLVLESEGESPSNWAKWLCCEVQRFNYFNEDFDGSRTYLVYFTNIYRKQMPDSRNFQLLANDEVGKYIFNYYLFVMVGIHNLTR